MSKTAKKAPKKPAAKKKAAPKKPAEKSKKKAAVKKVAKKAVKKTAPKKAGKKVVAKKPAKAGKKVITKKQVAKNTAKTGKKPALVFSKPVKKEVKPLSPLLSAIIEGLEERKAHNITVLDLTGISNRAFDYFVIADADSNTHVESIAASVEEEVKKRVNERPYHTEGWQNGEWILLDYINIMVHVFQRPIREFYNIEGLWADAEIQKIN